LREEGEASAACPETPEFVEYLAGALAAFMRTNRLNKQRWTKKRVADYITGSPDIDGTLSDTTLGRFLDPAYPQAPTAETIRKVAEFLILMGEVRREDIERFGGHSESRLAAALNAVHGQSGSGEREFRQDLGGQYVGAASQGGFLFESRLFLSTVPGSGAMHAEEIGRLYQVADPARLRTLTDNLDPVRNERLARAIRASGGVEIHHTVLSGFAIANAYFAAMLLREGGKPFSAALDVTAILFDDDDRITGLITRRNAGWQTQSPRETPLPIAITPRTPPRAVARQLSQEAHYQKQPVSALRRSDFDKRQEVMPQDKDIFDFYRTTMNEIEEEVVEKTKGIAPNERLLESLELGWIAVFRDALAAGADPNVVPPGENDPVVFMLARNGRNDWVEALIATGRCDLTRRDAEGMRPSFHPGVTARRLVAQGASDEARRFGDLAKRLRAEEDRQLGPTGPAPGAPAP